MSTIASAATVPAPTWLMPVLFLSHAAPVLFMKDDPMFGARNDCGIDSPAYKWYQSLPTKMNIAQGERRPKAIVMVSAHYETPGMFLSSLTTSTPLCLIYPFIRDRTTHISISILHLPFLGHLFRQSDGDSTR